MTGMKKGWFKMSNWTYVNGIITASPMGRTQAEKTYILDTVLSHLPLVRGSEGDMETYVIQKNGHDVFASRDEFGLNTNNLVDDWGIHDNRRGYMRTQSDYFIIVDGALRDTEFESTYRSFVKWLIRLSKRVMIIECSVTIRDFCKKVSINNDSLYRDMFEFPSWSAWTEDGDENWCEYLMWDAPHDEEGRALCGKPTLEDLKRGRFTYDE